MRQVPMEAISTLGHPGGYMIHGLVQFHFFFADGERGWMVAIMKEYSGLR